MGVFGFFNKYFDGADYERARVASLQKKLRQNERMLAKAAFRFSEYKDALVVQGIKISGDTKWADPVRAIASVMADSEYRDLPLPEPGGALFSKAKNLFTAGDYKRASLLFDDFVSNHPDNPNLPEASYLLVESFFLSDQIDRSIKQIDFLTTHFPETEYCGYALTRLGKIFESQDRTDEAVEIYEIVLTHFPKSGAALIATKMLKEIAP